MIKRILPFYLVLALSAAGCAEEQRMMLVPVVGTDSTQFVQMSDAVSSLRNAYPKLSPAAVSAIEQFDRKAFVLNAVQHRAYEDKPLPIGNGQYTLRLSEIAFILSELDIQPDDIIFEVGTGTGYLTAILSKLGKRVYSVEIIEYLWEIAKANFERLDISNITSRQKDTNGLDGWYEKNVLFDVVIMTASVSAIPNDILKQLKPEARIAVPIINETATDWVVYRWSNGELTELNRSRAMVSEAVAP